MYSPNLEKEDIDILLKAHEASKKEYQQQIDKLNYAIKRLDEKIANLKRLSIQPYNSHSRENYDPNWTWNNKITFILRTSMMPLTGKEIVRAILEFQPELQMKSVWSSVSATLSADKGEKYKRIEKEGKEIQYELITR
jgi:hypothetical protein